MRRLGTGEWAGLVMVVVSVAVAAPVLFGVAPTALPRGWWLTLFALFLLVLIGAAVLPAGRTRTGLVVGAVGLSWAVVLGAPGVGMLQVLLVVTVALTAHITALRVSMVIVVLNTAVAAGSALQASGRAVDAVVNGGFYLLIQLASVLSAVTLIREQALRRELTGANVELRAAGVLLSESARTAERLRISRELHDLIGHQLTVLTLELETARHLDGDAAREHVDRANGVARDLLGDVRETVGTLRSAPPDLDRALREVAGDLPGLDVSIEVAPDVRVDDERSAALIRAAQEAVTNTIRHAEARELWIEVRTDGAATVLRAHDDGRGAAVVEFGNGLRGLVERFEALGGGVDVDGRCGFSVTARVPAP